MQSFCFLFLLICYLSHVSCGKSGVHSGRIPANVKIYPKNDLKKSHLRLIPSNEDGNEHLSPSQFKQLSNSERFISPESQLPPHLRDLLPEHKILFQRAIQKDYDYAQFGQPCKVFTVDELEAFLGVLQESIESHEGESHLRISPQEKGEQLEQLFNHSRAICDLRNLLTCHKQFLSCACAHPSMGVNREGLCGINIGHSCELSGRTLLKHGILMTREMSPIKCLLENAECVMDSEGDVLGGRVSPIRKVCKCRNGFWGATCSRRHDPIGIKLVPPKRQSQDVKKDTQSEGLSEEVEVGRPIWVNEVGVASSEYFMHPEEIRDKLVELMNEEEMYPPELRAKEAQKLVKNLEVDVDKEEMVINDLHLRKLTHLKHGEKCNPDRQVILDNPPVAKDNAHRWTEPLPQDIKSWQLGLLQQKKPLCDVHKLLRCNEHTKVCECKPGLELDRKAGGKVINPLCKIPLGHNCDTDFEPMLVFDPLQDRKRFSEMLPPSCMPGTECTEKPLFFQKKCWCSAVNSNCDKRKFDEQTYSSITIALQSRFTLRLGDACDPKLHQQLLSYQVDEDLGYEKRLMLFREIIDNPESRLCDIENHLNCSSVSRTCECWKQLQPAERKDGDYDCVAMNMASCGRTFKYGKYLYASEGAQLWQVEKVFERRFLPGCVPGAICTGGNNPEWAGRCLCMNSTKSGETCTDSKSILARAFRASQIPQNDNEEMAVLRVYFDLNAQTALMEQLMTAGVNDVCDPNIGLTLDRIMKFWRDIANSSDTDMERRTLPYFIAATKWTKYLVNTVQGNSASLCNATVGLRCHRTTGRCGCHRGARWMEKKCYLDKDEQCDPKPGAEWVSTCIPGSKCLPVEEKRFKSYRCTSCIRQGRDDICVQKEEEEAANEEIWDTWNVYDDDRKEKRKRLVDDAELKSVMAEMSEVEQPSNPNAVRKRGWGKNGGIKRAEAISEDDVKPAVLKRSRNKDNEEEETKNYFVITPSRSRVESRANNTVNNKSPSSSTKIITKEAKRELQRQLHRPQGQNEANELNKHQRDAYLLEIQRMLKEIMEYRKIPFGESCINEDEEKLSQVFPTLPVYDLERLPTSIPMAYITLSRLYWKGISFCNRNLFLKCTTEAVCGCSFGFGLIQEDGECRLKENSYCDPELIHEGKRSSDFVPQANGNKRRHPIFQCQRGTKCTKIDYGLPVCVKVDEWDEIGQKEQGQAFLRQLPNDDFSRDTNDTEKPSGSSSWTHKEVSFLAIAVAVRMIITWAFV